MIWPLRDDIPCARLPASALLLVEMQLKRLGRPSGMFLTAIQTRDQLLQVGSDRKNPAPVLQTGFNCGRPPLHRSVE
ncbi:hypothetical protein P3T76_003938 [Phytophthora citrophthora]|uniref:Uncharacterized protein n=1 Tax=Phytophthora citrophthora TaxID=4793 RepID=A0AAD9GTX3_9STRA|nr:hypothetical protein P3T76_003938 [Phytophthora citrophthora]